MDFASMAQEYRESGNNIKNLMDDLKNRLNSWTLSSEQVHDIQNRLESLSTMYYECMDIVRELDRRANKIRC